MDFIVPLPPFPTEKIMKTEKKGRNECAEISILGGQGSQMHLHHGGGNKGWVLITT